MSHIRVRLQLSGFRLEYSGEGEFFDRVVDPLVAAGALSARPVSGSAGPQKQSTAPGASQGVDEARGLQGEAEDEGEDMGGDREDPAPGDAPSEPHGYRPESAAFGHFIRQLGPETGQPDRQVVAFAFFLWNYEKKEEVSEEEIAGCFKALGLPVPEDLPSLCKDVAEQKRFLDAAAAPGRWRLTQKGRNYVKTRLFVGA